MSKKIDPFADLTGSDVDPEPTTAIPAVLKHKPSSASRNRTWETAQRDTGRVVTYRGIPTETSTAIRDIADRLRVPVSEVARALLECGLREYQAGRLNLTPQFTGKLSLFQQN